MYMYICIYICMYIYIYMYIYIKVRFGFFLIRMSRFLGIITKKYFLNHTLHKISRTKILVILLKESKEIPIQKTKAQKCPNKFGF